MSRPAAPADAFPADLGLALDPDVRQTDGGRRLIGGDPVRALRLSAAGADALRRLLAAGRAPDRASARMARVLVDGGFAHPVPRAPATAPAVTVVIPTHGRPRALARCLDGCAGADAVVVVDDGSPEPGPIATVCADRGCRLIRHPIALGPAAARTAALAAGVDTPLVAFLDDDCVAPRGWLSALAGHFADPAVVAVAPRVRGVAGRSGPLAAAIAAVCPLDLGPRAARVAPGGRVAYVPSAALLVRTAAVRAAGFDPGLRFGEDVDLVWRLHDAGGTVRYDPTVSVTHTEPARLIDQLARRHRYGRSAAALAARHGSRVAPLRLSQSQAAWLIALASGRRRAALAVAAAGTARTAAELVGVGIPAPAAARLTVRAQGATLLAAARAATWLLGAPILWRGPARARALLALVPLVELAGDRRCATPLRFALLRLAGEIAYGTGVWAGSVRRRTLAPLAPVYIRKTP